METVIEQDIQFSPEQLREIEQFKSYFPEGKHKSAILRVLHMAQETFGGWLSVPVMDYVAEILQIQPIEVYEVASFYSMYNLHPVGKVMLEVCQTGPCCLVGAERIISHIENKLEIKVGE